jgi:hypothetical protein
VEELEAEGEERIEWGFCSHSIKGFHRFEIFDISYLDSDSHYSLVISCPALPTPHSEGF